MSEQRFIITADDYGVSPIIDDAVHQAVAKGLITSVAVLANGDNAVVKAKRLKKQFNEISIGIHFTITSGNRLCEKAYSLSKRSSKKNKAFRGILTQHPDKAKKDHLELELQAQIDEFEKEGLDIEFFSDHQGILSNTYKGLNTMLKVIKTYNQKKKLVNPDFISAKMRNPLFVSQVVDKGNCLDRSKMYSAAKTGVLAKNILRNKTLSKISFNFDTIKAFLKIIYMSGIDTPDYFIEHFYNNANTKTLKCISTSVPKVNNAERILFSQQMITYEMVVHIAIVPKNHNQNKSFIEEEKKIIKHGGVSVNYSLSKRNKEFTTLKKYLFVYFPKTKLVSFKF